MYARLEDLARDDKKRWMLTRISNQFHSGLRAYFYSGWTFLIPYLAAYLFYAWMKWPVNPVAAGSSTVGGGPWTVTPCLLHIYWFLHLIHLMLAVFALRAWWQRDGEERGATSEAPEPGIRPPPTVHRLPETVYRLLPWIFLGLLFYIPGVYLEFPADPWAHYARINEWSWLQAVTEHSTWTKSSYFMAYSLIGHITPLLSQLKWFDGYYSGCCLLLCWQYFRLSRATGLGERSSMIFVLLQSFLLGNNAFGFYRYYGMSSSLFAQLGAIALVRVVLEALSPRGEQSAQFARRPLRCLVSCCLLLALIAFNHLQGLGIAGLGIAAVVVWRLIEWRRTMIWWLAAGAITLSIFAIQWFPRQTALDEVYRPQGWLTGWYSFNLFEPSSPAFERAGEILGLSGLINLIGGLVLLRRNCIAGWLTLMPVVALSLPFIAIPFSNAFASHENAEIIVFQRLLFAVPAGLALCTLSASVLNRAPAAKRAESPPDLPNAPPRKSPSSARLPMVYASASFALAALGVLVIAPASDPSFNRMYNVITRLPADMGMRSTLEAANAFSAIEATSGRNPEIITTRGVGYVLGATGVRNVVNGGRLVPTTATQRANSMLHQLSQAVDAKIPTVLALPEAGELHTPLSYSGYLSQHWPPNEVAIEYTGRLELEQTANALKYRKIKTGTFTYYIYAP
jgi:hypothetical protein